MFQVERAESTADRIFTMRGGIRPSADGKRRVIRAGAPLFDFELTNSGKPRGICAGRPLFLFVTNEKSEYKDCL